MAGPNRNLDWDLNNRDLELYFHLFLGRPRWPDSRRKTASEITEIFEEYGLVGERFHPTQYDNSIKRLCRMGLFYKDGTPTRVAPQDFLRRFLKSYGRIRFDSAKWNSPVTRNWMRLGVLVINSIERNPDTRLFGGPLQEWELPMTAEWGHDLLRSNKFVGLLKPEEITQLDNLILNLRRDLIENLKSLEPLRKSWRARQGMRVASWLSRGYHRRFGKPLPALDRSRLINSITHREKNESAV